MATRQPDAVSYHCTSRWKAGHFTHYFAGEERDERSTNRLPLPAWGKIPTGFYDDPADQREELTEALLQEDQFLYDFLGDIDQGGGLNERAVKGIVRAIRAEMKRNPALAHRYKVLAQKEAKEVLKQEAERYR